MRSPAKLWKSLFLAYLLTGILVGFYAVYLDSIHVPIMPHLWSGSSSMPSFLFYPLAVLFVTVFWGVMAYSDLFLSHSWILSKGFWTVAILSFAVLTVLLYLKPQKR